MPTFESRMSDPTKLMSAAVSGATVKAISSGAIPQQLVGMTYFTIMLTGNLCRAGESEERITSVAPSMMTRRRSGR